MRKVITEILLGSALLAGATKTLFSQEVNPLVSHYNLWQNPIEWRTNRWVLPFPIATPFETTNDDWTKYSSNDLFFLAKADARYIQAYAQDMLSLFVKQHTTDVRKNAAFFYKGSLYLSQGEYDRARYYLEKVDDRNLVGESLAEWQVKMAYSLMVTKKGNKNLSMLFREAAKSNGYWGKVAQLYLASEILGEGKTDEALSLYRSLAGYNPLQTEAAIGEIICTYYKGNFPGSIRMAEALLRKDPKSANNPLLLRTLGNAYYRNGQTQQAGSFLELFFNKYASLANAEDRIVYGATLMEQKRMQQAIEVLKPASSATGVLGEVATLYLSRALREAGQYSEAIASYEGITGPKTNSSIRETAMYEMALVMRATKQSNFGQDVRIAEKFLNLFPNSRYKKTMEAFLLEFYFSNTDFENSYSSIARVKNKTKKLLEAEQYVLNGIVRKKTQEGEYRQAEKFLQKALQIGKSSSLYYAESILCKYQLAQVTGNNNEAIKALQQYLALKEGTTSTNCAEAQYQLGYLFFNNKNYSQAQDYFTQYINNNSSISQEKRGDSEARIGDCLLELGNLSAALQYFSNAMGILGAKDLYPAMRKAEILGLQKQYQEQIKTLDYVIRTAAANNAYKRKAYLLKGESYLQWGKTAQAENAFKETAQRYQHSEEGRNALLKLALVYYNQGNIDLAVKQYEAIIIGMPSSKEAQEAFENIKSISIEEGRTDILDKLMSYNGTGVSFSKQEDRALQLQVIHSAIDKKKPDALQQLQAFISKYKKGSDVSDARLLLADIYYKQGENDNAYKQYQTLEPDANELTLQQKYTLFVRMGDIEYALKKNQLAFRHYRMAYDASETRSQQTYTAARATFCANNGDLFEEGIAFAKKALSELGSEKTNDIQLSLGYLYTNVGNLKEANAIFKGLAKNSDSPEGAEATVAWAKNLYDAKQKANAKKVLNKFIEEGTPQEYWLARAIILLSNIYKAEGDKVSAKQYLNSLKNNYPNQNDDILPTVNNLLDELNKTNN